MRIVLPKRALALPVALLSMALLAVCVAAPAPAPTSAKRSSSAARTANRCSGFSQKDYSKALKELETSLEEYTDCASLIHQAQLAAAGSRGGSGGGGGGAPRPAAPRPPPRPPPRPSSSELEQRAEHRRGAAAARRPGRSAPASCTPTSPPPSARCPRPCWRSSLFLLACALVLAGGAIRNRVRARRARLIPPAPRAVARRPADELWRRARRAADRGVRRSASERRCGWPTLLIAGVFCFVTFFAGGGLHLAATTTMEMIAHARLRRRSSPPRWSSRPRAGARTGCGRLGCCSRSPR